MEVMLVSRFALQFAGIDASTGGVALAWSIAQFIIGFLAVLTSGLGFVLPWFTTITEIIHNESVGQRSSLSYVVAVFNCILWFVYGIVSPNGGSFISAIYLFGTMCQVVYLCKFWQYSQDQDFQWGLVILVPGLIGVGLVLVFYSSDPKGNLLFLSWACAICRVLLAVVPLLSLRNMDVMPSFLMSTVSLAEATLWTAFALTGPQTDQFILWPSLAGIASSIVQIVMHIVLRQILGLHEPIMVAP